MTEHERNISPETPKEQIISKYSSIFDQIPSDPHELEAYKERYKPSFAKIFDAWTIPELYSATKEIIDLPDTKDEREMRKNLINLCKAEIPRLHENPPFPAALWAFTIIDHHILMRYSSITSEKKG